MKRILAVLLAGIMTLSVASCGNSGSAGQGTAGNDSAVLDMRGEPAELNSMKTADAPGGNVLRMCMSGLARLDENDTPVADMAEKWDVSADQKTYTFHLRKDAKWTNGEPVTAKDFVYGWQTVLNKKTGAPYAYMLFTILENGEAVYNGEMTPDKLGVKAIDDYTLEVKLVNPTPYFLHLTTFSTFLPVNEKAYTTIGADKYGKDDSKIVTNGAYKIEKWAHDDHIQFVKNEDYFRKDEIKIPKVKYVMLKDQNAKVNSFKANEVDMVNVTGEQKKALESEGIEVKSYADNGSWYLEMNTQKKGLNNAKVRKAIMQAINTKALCENVRKDGSVPATGITPLGIKVDGKVFAEEVGQLVKYDVAAAKKLLDEGLKEEGLKADSFKVTIITEDGASAQKESQFYQAELQKALGIKVDVKPMPFKAKIAAMQSGDFDIAMAGWSPDYNDPMTYLEMFMTGNGNNHGKFSNKEYDKLLKDAMKEKDVAKRKELLIKAEKLLMEQAPIAPTYFSSGSYVVSKKLKGLTRTGFQEFDFTDGAEIVK